MGGGGMDCGDQVASVPAVCAECGRTFARSWTAAGGLGPDACPGCLAAPAPDEDETERARQVKLVVKDVRCPRCGVSEMHPDGEHLLIRGFKVQDECGHWWSQCLNCAGYYNEQLEPTPENFDPKKGWF